MGGFSSTAALLPGRNPTGLDNPLVYDPKAPGIGSTSGANPILPPTNLPSGAPQSNPNAPGSVVPTFGANSGPYTPTSLVPGGTGSLPGSGSGSNNFLSGMSQADIQRLHDELGNTYGNGVAAAIMSFLQGGAGFNQAAINNLFAALQPQINRGEEDLLSQFSTSGERFSSGAQIGVADYLSQVNLNEGEIETQMYEQSVNDFINTLMGVAGGTEKKLASSPGTGDTLGGIMNLVGAGAGAASAAGVGGTAGSILDVIASLGAAA